MKLRLTIKHTTKHAIWKAAPFITALLLILPVILITQLYPFLAPNLPPHHGQLIIEGWINDVALDEAINIYKKGNYSQIYCTGAPIETGSYLLPFKTYPEMTAARLLKKGITTNEITVITIPATQKDRTYTAALALAKHLNASPTKTTDLHLITIGPHGRRSRLLFKKALGRAYTLGITSLPDSAYPADRWYTYSQGVRSVISEAIAYLYARFLFYPNAL